MVRRRLIATLVLLPLLSIAPVRAGAVSWEHDGPPSLPGLWQHLASVVLAALGIGMDPDGTPGGINGRAAADTVPPTPDNSSDLGLGMDPNG